jgi:hypothetical protein
MTRPFCTRRRQVVWAVAAALASSLASPAAAQLNANEATELGFRFLAAIDRGDTPSALAMMEQVHNSTGRMLQMRRVRGPLSNTRLLPGHGPGTGRDATEARVVLVFESDAEHVVLFNRALRKTTRAYITVAKVQGELKVRSYAVDY